jgi:hypothetical protein
LENKKKVATNSPRSALEKQNRVEEGKSLRLKSEEGIGEHRFEGTKNDEG